MRPTFADFSDDPALLGNATVRHRLCHPADGHLAIDAGGGVEMTFTLEADDAPPERATLTVTARVSLSLEGLDHVPVGIEVNGRTLAADLTLPPAARSRTRRSRCPATCWSRLQHAARGRPRRGAPRAVAEPDHAGPRARGRRLPARGGPGGRARVGARLPHRAAPSGDGDASWQSAPQLLVHLDRGESALPTQLSWRGRDGAEASICFQAGWPSSTGTTAPPTARSPTTAADWRAAGPSRGRGGRRAARRVRGGGAPVPYGGDGGGARTAAGTPPANCGCWSRTAEPRWSG
ncbi:hypothetical protein NKH77_16530 [Streptomyces sp. M19]